MQFKMHSTQSKMHLNLLENVQLKLHLQFAIFLLFSSVKTETEEKIKDDRC